MWRLGLACPVVCVALAACGGGSPEAGTTVPATQPVPNGQARTLLVRAFRAARAIGREDGACRGCYPTDPSEITEDMKMAAARGIASIVTDAELREDYIIPSVFNRDVADAVAAAVAAQAKADGSAVANGDEIGYAPGDTQEFRAVST